jgi:hypothetical protein
MRADYDSGPLLATAGRNAQPEPRRMLGARSNTRGTGMTCACFWLEQAGGRAAVQLSGASSYGQF